MSEEDGACLAVRARGEAGGHRILVWNVEVEGVRDLKLAARRDVAPNCGFDGLGFDSPQGEVMERSSGSLGPAAC